MNTTNLKEKTVTAARKAAPYVRPTARFIAVWTFLACAWTVMLMVWSVQFTVVLAAQLFWRLLKGVGLIAWLVFFFPIGWIVLPFLLYGRAKHGTPILGEKHYSTRPWLLDQLLNIAR